MPSPSAILRGETDVVAPSERSTLIRPAPSRNGDSRRPRPGLPLQTIGTALFESSVGMLEGDLPAERSTAAAPATCGVAIEVPLITL